MIRLGWPRAAIPSDTGVLGRGVPVEKSSEPDVDGVCHICNVLVTSSGQDGIRGEGLEGCPPYQNQGKAYVMLCRLILRIDGTGYTILPSTTGNCHSPGRQDLLAA